MSKRHYLESVGKGYERYEWITLFKYTYYLETEIVISNIEVVLEAYYRRFPDEVSQ